MKNKKIVIALSCTLVALIIALGVIWKFTRPETNSDLKNISFTVTYADGKNKEYKIDTEREFLADALLDEKLLLETEKESGFYNTVAGVTADYNTDKSFWWIKANGEDSTVGMNELAINDGDNFEAIYTISDN